MSSLSLTTITRTIRRTTCTESDARVAVLKRERPTRSLQITTRRRRTTWSMFCARQIRSSTHGWSSWARAHTERVSSIGAVNSQSNLFSPPEGNYRGKGNSGGMRNNMRSNDMGHQMRSNGAPNGGMKRRWDNDANGGQKRPPYQQNSSFSGSMNGGMGSTGASSYQPKPFRPNSYDQNKPTMTSTSSYQPPSYAKYSGYAPMSMTPALTQYPGIASAVANYAFPPPQSSVMPPLPK